MKNDLHSPSHPLINESRAHPFMHAHTDGHTHTHTVAELSVRGHAKLDITYTQRPTIINDCVASTSASTTGGVACCVYCMCDCMTMCVCVCVCHSFCQMNRKISAHMILHTVSAKACRLPPSVATPPRLTLLLPSPTRRTLHLTWHT